MPLFTGISPTGNLLVGICDKDWASVKKSRFPWALEFAIEFAEVTEAGLPTPDENEAVNVFEEWLIESVRKATNVHFVCHITGDGYRVVHCYLPDAERAQFVLKNIVKHPTEREFEYRITRDPNWARVAEITKDF